MKEAGEMALRETEKHPHTFFISSNLIPAIRRMFRIIKSKTSGLLLLFLMSANPGIQSY